MVINESENLTLERAIQISQKFEYSRDQLKLISNTTSTPSAASVSSEVDHIARKKKGETIPIVMLMIKCKFVTNVKSQKPYKQYKNNVTPECNNY